MIITSGPVSNQLKDAHVTDSYALVPNYYIERRVWLNLVIDLRSLYNNLYKGCTYRSIEGIEISSACKLRRVMTLNNNQMQLLSMVGF